MGDRAMEYRPDVLEKLHAMEYEILVEVDRVCENLGLVYFLDSGTALGAVRHAGFIPWDDDVDLGMMREDYAKFLREAPGLLGEGYELCYPGKTEHYATLFAKVMKKGTAFWTKETSEAGFEQGVFVDIFPYDRFDGNEGGTLRRVRSCQKWQYLSYLYHSKTITVPHDGALGSAERFACRMAHSVVRRFFDEGTILRKYDRAVAAFATGGDSCIFCGYPIGRGFPLDMMLPVSSAEFQGRRFPVPHDVEGYLETMYGKDWRELPPKEKRRNHMPQELNFGELQGNSH